MYSFQLLMLCGMISITIACMFIILLVLDIIGVI